MKKSPSRHEEMLKLQESLKPELEKFESLSYASTSDPHSPIYGILHKKIKDTTTVSVVRAYFAFKMAQYLRHEGGNIKRGYKKFFDRQLPFIMEAIISVQYYHNQILDGKAGVTTSKAINDNLVTANLFKDQLYRYIEQLEITQFDRRKVKECVRSIFEYVDIGQYIEKHCNTYGALQNGSLNHPFENAIQKVIDTNYLETTFEIAKKWGRIEQCYDAFLKIYLERIYLVNAVLYQLLLLLITALMKNSNEVKKNCAEFAIYWGLTQQIVNDNNDLVPSIYGEATVEKICRDAFSDIRNKNVTLPVLIHLQRCPKSKIYDCLEGGSDPIIEMEEEYFREATKELSIYYSMTIGKKLKSIAIKILNQYNKVYPFIADMLRVAENNRYYKCFYNNNNGEDYKHYQESKKNRTNDTQDSSDEAKNI